MEIVNGIQEMPLGSQSSYLLFFIITVKSYLLRCRPASEHFTISPYFELNHDMPVNQQLFFPPSQGGKVVSVHLLSISDSPKALQEIYNVALGQHVKVRLGRYITHAA